MKKNWSNPEISGLGIDQTNQEKNEVRFTTVKPLGESGGVKFLCLGVFVKGTGIKISDCPSPGPYDSYLLWAVHASDIHANLEIGEEVAITPVSS